MRFALRVALRYIFSKKSTQAINIISGITMFGITIGSAALIIILSAFNGFGNLVLGLYGSFYPDITVQPIPGDGRSGMWPLAWKRMPWWPTTTRRV